MWWVWLWACAIPDPATAETCGACHADQYDAWSRSPHASSARSPVFLASLPEVSAAWGETAAARCEACHAPGHGGDEGVGCVACHAAVGNRAEADGELIVDTRAPIAGPTGGPAPHATAARPLLTDPALCNTCHEVNGPGLLDEHTGAEHRASGEARTCADCHLDGHATPGLEPMGDPAYEDRVRRLLRAALTWTAERGPEGVAVTVTNTGAGHDVPTGAAAWRDLRVEVRSGDGPPSTLLTLAPRPAADGVPVPLVTDADGFEGRGLRRGESRRAVASGEIVEACLVFRPWRLDATEALGVEPAPQVVVDCLAP